MTDRQQKVDAGKRKFLKLRTKKKNSVLSSTPITTTKNAKTEDATSNSSVPLAPVGESGLTVAHPNVQVSPATIAATPAYRDLLESYQVDGSVGTSRSNTPVPSLILPASQTESVTKNLQDDAVQPVPSVVVSEDTDSNDVGSISTPEPNRTTPESLYRDSKSSDYVQPTTVDITSATMAATSVRKPDLKNKTGDVFLESTLTGPDPRIVPSKRRVDEPLPPLETKIVHTLADSKQSNIMDMYHDKFTVESAIFAANRQSSVLDMYHEKITTEEFKKISQKSFFAANPNRQSSVLDMYHENPKAQISILLTDPVRQSSVLDMYHEKPGEKDTIPQLNPETLHSKALKQPENRRSLLNTEPSTNRFPLSTKNSSPSSFPSNTKSIIPRRPFLTNFGDEYQNPNVSEENLLASYYCLPTSSNLESNRETTIATDTERSRYRTVVRDAVSPVQEQGKRTVAPISDKDAETTNAGTSSFVVKANFEEEENELRDGTDELLQQKRSNDLEKSLEAALMAFRKEKTDREMLERVVGENVMAMNESLDRFMAEKESLQFENVSLKRKLGEAMNRLEKEEKTNDRRGVPERTREGQEGVRSRARSVGIATRKDASEKTGNRGSSEVASNASSDSPTLSSRSKKATSRRECPECESLRNELRTKNLDLEDMEKGRILLERKLEFLINEKEESRIQSAAKFRFLSNRIQGLESEKIAVAAASVHSTSLTATELEKETTDDDDEAEVIKNLQKQIHELNEERKRECGAYESRIMELDLQVSRLIKSNETLDRDHFDATNRGKMRAKEIERLIQIQRERDEQHGKEKQAYERRLSVFDKKNSSLERRGSLPEDDENMMDRFEREVERLNSYNSELKNRVRECESVISKTDGTSRSEDASSSNTVPTSNHGEFTNTSRSHLVKLILELTSINRDLSAKYHTLRKQINRVPTPTVYRTFNDSTHADTSCTSVSQLTA